MTEGSKNPKLLVIRAKGLCWSALEWSMRAVGAQHFSIFDPLDSMKKADS